MKELRKLLKKSSHFLILMHSNPDMDAIGSAYALLLFLRGQGKSAFIGIERPLYQKYSFFIPNQDLRNFFLTKNEIMHKEFDWIITVDTSEPFMLGEYTDYIKSKNTIVIDHHHTFTPFGTVNLNLSHMSSTCEMIYDLLEGKLTCPDMANALYAGIVYDTGNFRYSSTTPALMRKIACLLENFPLDTEAIFFHIFENESLERKKLIAKIVSSIEQHANGELVVSYFPLKYKKGLELEDSDMLDLVSIGHSVKGCRVSVFVKEKEDGIYFSFRSRNDFDVAALARQWGGGGHQKASGLKLQQISLDKVRADFIPQFIEHYNHWRVSNAS